MAAGHGPACLALVVLVLLQPGEAGTPLKADGPAGVWDQLLVGGAEAYPKRTGGLTLKAANPGLSLVDRDSPGTFTERWDVTTIGTDLGFLRAGSAPTLQFDQHGNARFNGLLEVQGTLRTKDLVLDKGLQLGLPGSPTLRLGADKLRGWLETERAGSLALNPESKRSGEGVSVFTSEPPKKQLDVAGELWLEKPLKLGGGQEAALSDSELKLTNGGGWRSGADGWLENVGKVAVHVQGGGVFGKPLMIGCKHGEACAAKGAQVQVHGGHLVVSEHVSQRLKGLATFTMPSGSFIKAYDYTNKKLDKLRITGTRVLLNPSLSSDAKTCIGCTDPQYHLQAKGNMYVNGNVFVNKNMHVAGNMHIDKVITPRVLIHSRAQDPEYGRGLMIGNDLPNKHNTKTNMRLGYNRGYGWVQSHNNGVPLVLNPIGGASCVSCTALSKEGVVLEVRGDALVDGEVYAATLGQEELLESSLSLLQSADSREAVGQELQAEHMDLVHAWAAATNAIKRNNRVLQKRRQEIQANAELISNLEAKIANM